LPSPATYNVIPAKAGIPTCFRIAAVFSRNGNALKPGRNQLGRGAFGGEPAREPGFERYQSMYSNVRARDDAEVRVARTIADELKVRLSAFLSRTPA